MSKRKIKKRKKPPDAHAEPKWGNATSVAPNAFCRWMDTHNLKAVEVAGMLGISRAAVYDLRRRLYLPGLELANRIERTAATVGEPAVATSSWSKEPTQEDLALAEVSHQLALQARSTRRQSARGPMLEPGELEERRRQAMLLPPASVLLALPEDFDEEDA